MRYGRRISSGYRPMRQVRRRRRFRVNVPAVVLALVLVAGVGLGAAALSGLFKGTSAQNTDNMPGVSTEGKFANGVIVDGMPLGGLTWEEAKQKVAAAQQARIDAIAVTVTDGSAKLTFTAENVKCSFDTDEVLLKAKGQNTAGEYKTTLNVDATQIEQDIRTFADSLYIPAYNSIVLDYDKLKPDGQRFTFTDDRPGKKINSDTLWADVKKAFEQGTFGTVQAVVENVPATARKAVLESNCRLIVSYQSTMSDHSRERLKNITLAAQAVSRRIIAPGGEFSFNEATGERTAAAGYLVAHVLTAGVEDNGLGGGVCQVSGTLFNAAARANLDIVKRTPHSIPSSYLTKGQDATVDYPRKDLVIRNNGTTPVIIVMQVDDKSPWKVTAEIYGVPFLAGETIELESQTTKVLPKLDTVRYEDSDAMAPGETKVIKPRDGYEIAVFRLYKKDGAEVRREKLDTVTYQPYGTVMLYNPDDPKPSGLPTASPSPTPKPSATPRPANTPTPNTTEPAATQETAN